MRNKFKYKSIEGINSRNAEVTDGRWLSGYPFFLSFWWKFTAVELCCGASSNSSLTRLRRGITQLRSCDVDLRVLGTFYAGFLRLVTCNDARNEIVVTMSPLKAPRVQPLFYHPRYISNYPKHFLCSLYLLYSSLNTWSTDDISYFIHSNPLSKCIVTQISYDSQSYFKFCIRGISSRVLYNLYILFMYVCRKRIYYNGILSNNAVYREKSCSVRECGKAKPLYIICWPCKVYILSKYYL